MKLCITTTIKDEHLYLDDFIKYHLELGIDHIFIFEDVDSKTHKAICDDYEDVTLFSINDLFQSKLTSKPKQQNTYIKMLEFIKLNYDYDWCFALDIDEYITLEKDKDNLNDVMARYNRYTALLLKWVNYGADGRITMPNYSNIRITDAYKKKALPMKVDTNRNTTKVAYNMKVFNKSFIYNYHLPKEDVGWCWPDYTRDLSKPCIKTIYLRHYITKSWQEYVWKLEVRGQYTFHTTYDSFFEANKDMENMKDDLMKQIDHFKSKVSIGAFRRIKRNV